MIHAVTKIQYLPLDLWSIKEHKPMISGCLCMNCSLKHLLSMHSLVNRHPIPDTTCSRLETTEMLPPGSSRFVTTGWLFYHMCCWV